MVRIWIIGVTNLLLLLLHLLKVNKSCFGLRFVFSRVLAKHFWPLKTESLWEWHYHIPEGNRKEKAKERRPPQYKGEAVTPLKSFMVILSSFLVLKLLSYFQLESSLSSFSQQPFWLRGANPTPNSDLAVSIKLLCHKVLTPQILRPTRFSLLGLVLEVVKLAREEMHTRERQLRSKVSWKTKGNLVGVRPENDCDNDIDQGDTSAGIPLHGKLYSTIAFRETGDWHTNGAGSKALMMKSKNLRWV